MKTSYSLIHQVALRLHNEIENLEEKCSKSEAESERHIEELQESETKQQQLEKEIRRLQLAVRYI